MRVIPSFATKVALANLERERYLEAQRKRRREAVIRAYELQASREPSWVTIAAHARSRGRVFVRGAA